MILTEAKLHSKMEFQGMDISIEIPAGGVRTGISKHTGEKWEHPIDDHYGYIKGTHSPDGEHLDCYVRKNPNTDAKVYVMHQLTVDGSKFDEDKVMLGYSSKSEAVKAFKKFTFKPDVMFGGVSEFSLDHFKVIAYQASKSHAMLASEETYQDFKNKGLIGKGIKSPVQVAKLVSEDLKMGFESIINEILSDPIADIVNEVKNEGYANSTILDEAYLRYIDTTETPISMQRFFEDYKHMIDDIEEFDEYTDSPILFYETPSDMISAFQFARDNGIKCKALDQWEADNGDIYTNVIVFSDSHELETFINDIENGGEPEYAGNMAKSYFPEDVNTDMISNTLDNPFMKDKYVVLVKTHEMINMGTTDAPKFASGPEKVYEFKTDLTINEANKIARDFNKAQLNDIIPENEIIDGVDVVEQNFYKSMIKEGTSSKTSLNESRSFVSDLQYKAGVLPNNTSKRDESCIYLSRHKIQSVEDNSFINENKEELLKAIRITENTIVKNKNFTLKQISKAVSEKVFGNDKHGDLISKLVESQEKNHDQIIYVENIFETMKELDPFVTNGIIKYRILSENNILLTGTVNSVDKIKKHLAER